MKRLIKILEKQFLKIINLFQVFFVFLSGLLGFTKKINKIFFVQVYQILNTRNFDYVFNVNETRR